MDPESQQTGTVVSNVLPTVMRNNPSQAVMQVFRQNNVPGSVTV